MNPLEDLMNYGEPSNYANSDSDEDNDTSTRPNDNIVIDIADILQHTQRFVPVFRRCYFLLNNVFSSVHQSHSGYGRKRIDGRTWKNRIRQMDANWKPLLQPLTEAFIQWKYQEAPVITTFTNPNAQPVVQGWDFDQNIIDLYTLACVAVIPRDETTSVAVALVQAGYLGASPNNPSFAVSLRTLELFYTIRLFRPSFSVEAFAKVVTHTMAVNFIVPAVR